VPVVLIYARKSSDPGEQKISVNNQLANCRKLATELFPDLPVLEFADNNLSGFDPGVVRPDFNRFLAAVRTCDPGSQVIVNEQSRLTRQPQQWEDLVVAFARASIPKIHCFLGGVIDVGGSKLLGRILAAVDAEEAERASARYKGMHERLRDEGRPGSKVGYGFRKVEGPDGRAAWEHEPDEAAVLVAVSDALCDGFSLGSIVKQLNDGTIPAPKRKGPWRQNNVKRLLLRPSIAGFRTRSVWTPVVGPEGEDSRRHHEEIIGIARWDPILTESRWRQTLDALNARSVKGDDGKGGKKEYMVERKIERHPRRWLLTNGIGRCGRCNGRLYATGMGGGPRPGPAPYEHLKDKRCYACMRVHGGCGKLTIGPAEKLDAWVHDQLTDYMATNPKVLATIGDHNPERDRLEEERRRAKRTMDEIDELRATDEIDPARWRSMNARAKERYDQAQRAIDALPVLESDIPDLEAVRDHWDELPLARRLRALGYYAKAVIVKPSPNGRGPSDVNKRMEARVDIDWKR
jgi:DNA invertase Pin-like site-specific DNA recombinase